MEPIKILFAHRDYVVCVKPAGVLSQNGKPGQDSMVSLLEKQLGGTIYPVHRLDRETGGVMVYARTSVGAARLSRQIQQGQLRKEYLASFGAPLSSLRVCWRIFSSMMPAGISPMW